jgi:hypothetical protein
MSRKARRGRRPEVEPQAAVPGKTSSAWSLVIRLSVCALIVSLSLLLASQLNAAVEQGKSTCRNVFVGQTDPLSPTESCYFPDVPGLSRSATVDVWRFHADMLAIFLAVFGGSFVLYPEAPRLIALGRSHWRNGHTMTALGVTAASLAAFILYYGNRQFGGFDHSIVVAVGWRLFQGQVPYRDFVCTLPPGFFLGVKYAFQLFGIRWTSILLVTAILASASFLWTYFLLRGLLGSRLIAFLTALSVQCAAVLTYSYWWYNSVTTVAATVLFLSCLLYLKEGPRPAIQLSYFASLALMGLMKPNISALTIFLGVTLLFLAMPSKTRLLVLTASAVVAALAILAVNHVSVSGMLASYVVVIRERGRTPAFGFYMVKREDITRALILFAALLPPYLTWWPQFRHATASRDRRRIASLLLLLGGPCISVAAMLTNNDVKDVEWPLAICSGVLLLRQVVENAWLRRTILLRLYVCALLALAFTDLYLGVTRYRVFLIGSHRFFEWRDPLPNPGTTFFPGMRAGPHLQDAMTEIARVLQEDPGNTFLGPRLEFAYAAFGLPAPTGLPIWWNPAAAFALEDEPRLIEVWRQKHFKTIILLAGDTTYYSPLFVKLIQATYEPDPRWETITVLRRK